MRAQKQIAVWTLLLFLVACASTPDQESSQFWTARQSFVSAQETWNDMLLMDNERVRSGEKPLFSERDRQIALLITRQAYEIFEKTEPLLGDESHKAEVLLAIGQLQALGFQLAMLYMGRES